MRVPRRYCSWGCLSLLLSAAAVEAQPAIHSAADPVVVIHAGTLLAVPGNAPKSKQTIIIRGGRIAEVRDGYSSVQAAPGIPVQTIDLEHRFVLPGMIDLHVHLTTEAEEGEALRVVTLDSAHLALVARRHALETLNAGFTTVLDLGTARRAHNEAINALRRAIDNGTAVGPRLLIAGSPISTTGSSRTGRFASDVESVVGPEGTCDGAESCERAVREQVANGADAINFYNTGSVGDVQIADQVMTQAEMNAIVSTAHALGRKVVADGHTARGINAALRAGADIIDTAPWPDAESLDLMLRQHAFLEAHMHAFVVAVAETRSGSTTVPDEQASPIIARLRAVLAQPFSAQKAFQAGIALAYGSDAGIVRHGDNAAELIELTRIGMTPLQAIQVATVNSAQAIGLSTEIGSIEVGKVADVIALEGRPLEDVGDLMRVTFVMRGGHVIKNQ